MLVVISGDKMFRQIQYDDCSLNEKLDNCSDNFPECQRERGSTYHTKFDRKITRMFEFLK